MKIIRLIVSGILLFSPGRGAYASDSVDLTISATLEAGACTPTLDKGGEANFGEIPLGNLSRTQTNQLGSRYLTLTISCTESMRVGWSVTDNKKESLQPLLIKNPKYNGEDLNDGGFEFGLGRTAGGTKIGAYAIYVDKENILADGAKLKMIYKTNSGSYWMTSGAGEIGNDSAWIYAGETWGGTDAVVVSGKTFVWPLKITAAIQGTDTLAVTDRAMLDGVTTISVVYL